MTLYRRKPRPINTLLLKTVFLFLSLLIFLPSQARAQAPKAAVTEIKHWSNPDYTRIVISLSDRAAFSHRLLKKDPSINKPRRLYIDISGASLDKNLRRSIPINDGLLKAARAGQYDKDTVRVVLDIESIEDYKVIPLSDPFRIIIDVTGEKSKAEAAGPPAQTRSVPKGSPAPPVKEARLKVRKIVIDAGHGGKDPGATGKGGLKEKDVTLRIARHLRETLAKKIPSKIIMTRDTDVFIPLEERTAIANKNDADLFVSIHINSSPRGAASGVETYILNVSKDEESRRLAARENATSRKAVSDLEFILNDLIKTAKTNDSIRLATSVHERLVYRLRQDYRDLKSNGVKGAPFYVLVGTRMPSILIEVSFISNPTEEKRLRSEKYIEEVVEGISNGLLNYINGAGTV